MIPGYFFERSLRWWIAIGEEGREEAIKRQLDLLAEIKHMPRETFDDKVTRVGAFMRGMLEIERAVSQKYIPGVIAKVEGGE